jgi:hypothetical protein
MGLFKEEMLEHLKIEKALDAIGYELQGFTKNVWFGKGTLSVSVCEPGEHREQISRQEDIVRNLPETAGRREFMAICYDRPNQARQASS